MVVWDFDLIWAKVAGSESTMASVVNQMNLLLV